MKGFAIILISACVVAAPVPAETLGPVSKCRVAFSPRGDGLDLILEELKAAKQTVHAGLFYLSNHDLIDALLYLAAKTPVKVTLYLDQEMARAAHVQTLNRLAEAGATIYIEELAGNGKLHLKGAVVDGRTVITGSSNWTQSAFGDNCEDTVVLDSAAFATFYLEAYRTLQASCRLFEGATPEDPSIPAKFPKGKTYTRNRKDLRPVAPRLQAFRDVSQSEAYFTPGRAGVDRLIRLVSTASRRVDIGIYYLSDPAVIDALRTAAQRPGLQIRVVADDIMLSGTQLTNLQRLHEAGIPVFTMEDDSASMHLKSAVIDEQVVVTGSHNWTPSAAENNVEDMLFLVSRRLAQYYTSYLDYLAETHAIAYTAIDRESMVAAQDDVVAPSGLQRAGVIDYPASLPKTGPRRRYGDVFTRPEEVAWEVNGSVEYLDDEEYLAVLQELIRTANQSILISLYHVADGSRAKTLHAIMDQLGEAADRGVYVYAVLNMPLNQSDSQQEAHSGVAEKLRQRGVDVRLGVPTHTLHEKLIVVDLAKILVGSHNWSEGALTGERVLEASAFIVLDQQDHRWAQRILRHPTVKDMRNRKTWESELSLLRHIAALKGQEREAFLQRLERSR